MAGDTQSLKIMTIDHNDILNVMHYNGGKFEKMGTYAKVKNVCYPFRLFKAIQPCDEKQYKEITGDLQ